MKKTLVLIGLICHLSVHAQNVGIGTTNPTKAKLEVHGAVDATAAIFGGDGTGISLQRNWPGIGFNHYYNNGHRYLADGYGARQFFDPTVGYMAFDMFGKGISNGTPNFSYRAFTIYPAGIIQFGPNYFNSNLTVSRGYNQQATAYLFGTKHHSAFNYDFSEDTYIRAGKDFGTVFINDIPNGKVVMTGPVGINTATPGFSLEVRQNLGTGLALVQPTSFDYWHLFTGQASPGDGPLWLQFRSNAKGWFSPTDGVYRAISDKRLKTGIAALPSVLSKVLQLQPVNYQMITDNPQHKQTMGFLAQDVKLLFPELVDVITDTTVSKGLPNLHTLNYSGFGVLAIKAIQEQQTLIDALRREVNELKQDRRPAEK